MVTYDGIAQEVVAVVPEFAPVVDEHLRVFDGEILPHVLFGDFTRFVLAAYSDCNPELVGRCLDFLEGALDSPDPRVGNLVAVSFVENVGPWDARCAPFISTWPAGLRNEAERQRASKRTRP